MIRIPDLNNEHRDRSLFFGVKFGIDTFELIPTETAQYSAIVKIKTNLSKRSIFLTCVSDIENPLLLKSENMLSIPHLMP